MAESTSKQLEGLRNKRVVFNTNRGGTIKSLTEGTAWEIAKEAILIKWQNGGWIWIPRGDIDKYEIVEVLEGEGPNKPTVLLRPDPLSVAGMRAEDATLLQAAAIKIAVGLVASGSHDQGTVEGPAMTYIPLIDSVRVADKAIHLAIELCKQLDEMENPPKAGPNEQLDKDLG